MKQCIQFIGLWCSYILGLRLSKILDNVFKHFYTGLRKRYFKKWGKHSVIKFRAQQLIGLEFVKVGRDCSLGKKIQLTAWNKYEGQIFSPSITIGDGCVIGCNAHITAINRITIGNKLLTGSNVLITDNSHGNCTFEERDIVPMKRPLMSKGPVVIEDNVWLGDNVCVLANVTIGKGAVIGANSVVTHSIPQYSIAVGAPAKVIKTIGKT